MATIRSVLFDFGGVMAFFDLTKAYAHLARMSAHGLSAREVGDSIQDLREVYEHGRMSTPEFVGALQSRLQLMATASEIAAAWCDIFRPNPAVLGLIPRLHRASYRLVLGSNTNELHYQHFRQQFAETLDLFHGRVLSYELKIKKPDRRFYSACLTVTECPPAECVYVDDLADCVAAARRRGIASVMYDPRVDLVNMFQSLGLSVA